MSDETLFNCCTNGVAPDWSQYDGLELGGCRFDSDEGHVNGGLDRHEAEFFTVYGHLNEGGCEAITDIMGDFDAAERVGEKLAELSGLELQIMC